ncbi:hypothetical protein ABT369_56080 [Dactylosporangium sp. NPDC000244]|uniref:hypothetical protein n=1 Tax=Dactylosporangium sp. NPDC000244 TaxID=3154365 RepID=UPI00332E330E
MHHDLHVHRTRAYYWGAIYISDADCRQDFDIDFHHGGRPVLSTAAHVAVVVLHARTVDEGEADVTLEVRVSTQRAEDLPYEVAFDVPSGRLWIGDPDGDDVVALRPGRWLLQFAVDDPEEARHVQLVASPL